MRKKLLLLALCMLMLSGVVPPPLTAAAQGPTYTAMQDVYYTKENCVVYAEPTYTSTVLTTLGANLPVQVIGMYSNGWYRINIGVICYVKMDSLTTAGALGIANAADAQVAEAKKTADELGYEFVVLTLNKEKIIKKDIFNSYIGRKAILYVKIDDELGVSFKMLYNDKVKTDINLNYTKTVTTGGMGDRVVYFDFDEDTELFGQIAIFQFREGYDKAVDIEINDLKDTYTPIYMNTYYTEFSEFAYAPVTQVSDMRITEYEIPNSLTDKQREKMANLRKGIKYQSYDDKDYRSSINGRLRKDTEYVDYNY